MDVGFAPLLAPLARPLLWPPFGFRGRAAMAVELWASLEFARWFEWLAAADPPAASDLAGAVDFYAAKVEAEDKVAFDVCASPSGQLAFVAAHAAGVVFLATGAEIEGSARRTMTLVSRARKV